MRVPSFLRALSMLLLALALPVSADAPYDRAAFRAAYDAAITQGEHPGLAADLATFQDHLLLPYLEAAALIGALERSSPSDATELRQRIAEHLRAHPQLALEPLREAALFDAVGAMDWDAVLALSDGEEADPRLVCGHMQARLERDADAGLARDALAFWSVGKDRPTLCDPVFTWLDQRGSLTPDHYRSRIAAALEAKAFGLARHLLDQAALGDVQLSRRVQGLSLAEDDPYAGLERFAEGGGPVAHEVLAHAIARIAETDPRAAAEQHRRVADAMDETHRRRSWREVALWAARLHLPEARDWLTEARSETWVRNWQARAALRELDWGGVRDAILGMPRAQRDERKWQYWLARSMEHLDVVSPGFAKDARRRYRRLAKEDDYYGYLAADRLGAPYALESEPSERDTARYAVLAARADLLRVRELHLVGLEHLARAEWERITGEMDRADRAQAALLADDWGWHAAAVRLAWQAGLGRDLDLRYPTPWHDDIHRLAEHRGIDESWVYGIIRSESLFEVDAISHAGAYGLMQVMPATGEQLARDLGWRWEGTEMLTRRDVNLAFGTEYLRAMRERFQAHEVLASAAYNAGPHRVERWLPVDHALPADVWAETVPFQETRRYIRRVFTASVIFDRSLHREPVRLSARMAPVQPAVVLAKADEAERPASP